MAGAVGLALALSLAARAAEAQASPPAVAQEAGGVRFEGAQQLGDRALQLNGVGVRSKMYIRIYAMGLYLPQPESDVRAVMAPELPHRIALVLLRDVDAQRMSDGLAHAMLEGVSAEQASALRARVGQLAQALHEHGDVKRGDVMWLDYSPHTGTQVSIQGQPVGQAIAGADFNAAMLAMWLGDHAPDDKLKAALLGQGQRP